MKLRPIFYIIPLITLAGCSNISNNLSPISSGYIIGTISTGIVHSDSYVKHDISFEDKNDVAIFSSGTSLPLSLGKNIIIKDSTITYKNIFYFTLPDISKWEFQHNKYDSLWAEQKIDNASFSFTQSPILPHYDGQNDQQICNDSVVGRMTKTRTSTISGVVLYLSNFSYPESTYTTHQLCFIYDDMVYNISLTNYKKTTIDNIFSSLRFVLPAPISPTQKTTTAQTSFLFGDDTTYYLSGQYFIYNNLFSLKIPKLFPYRKEIYAGTGNIDLYFLEHAFVGIEKKEEQPYLSIRSFNLREIPESTIEKKCLLILGNPTTLSLGYSGTYVTTRTRDVFGYLRRGGGICFSKNNLLYNISFITYTRQDIKSIIDSFTLLD